jgi:hypothetical protein
VGEESSDTLGVNPLIEASSFVDRFVFEFLELCQLLVRLGALSTKC